jgi:hypothetical protein
MDDVSYGVLALALTLVAGTWTWFAYRRRGIGAGLTGAGITLLPVAAYLTDTLRMFGRIGGAIGDWATGLVLSPSVWAGIVLAGLGVLLFGAGRAVTARTGDRPAPARGDQGRGQLPASSPATRPGTSPAPVDDEMADIEALLRNRGIT